MSNQPINMCIILGLGLEFFGKVFDLRKQKALEWLMALRLP